MFLYFIYLIFSPILWISLRVVGLFNIKVKRHLHDESKTWQEAFEKIRKFKNNRRIVLFHSASAGEFEQIKPILRRVDRSKYFILQTFFSPTIYEKEKDSALLDAVCYQPFDFLWSVLRFFSKFKPDIYIITRHDVWPNHVYISKLMEIKTYLINGNLYKESSRLKFPLILFNRWVYNNFDLIMTGSERLSSNFQKLVSVEKIIITGDSRFDQILERKEHNIVESFPKKFLGSKNIIFGSIIDSDFDIVFGAITQFYSNGDTSLQKKNNRIIIVPHEVDEKTLQTIETRLEKIGISSQRFAKINETIEANVLIVDTVGILADLYKYADLAYVGAGFGAGVHSVIEPAAYGCIIAFGPNIKILDEAISLYNLKLGKMIFSVENLTDFFNLINDLYKVETLKKSVLRFVEKNSNASEKIIKLVLK